MPERSLIRTTVYFDPFVHRALQMKAAETDCSISDLVNDAVRQVLVRDLEDIETFDTREHEADYVFEDVVKDLQRRGRI